MSAGGRPLDDSLIVTIFSKTSSVDGEKYDQKLVLKKEQHMQETFEAVYNQRFEEGRDADLISNQAKQQIGTDPDSIVNDMLEKQIYDYDPEYAEALSEIDRRHSLYKLTHRDLQWKVVVEVMRELSNDEKVDLITHVRRYPLHRRLPPTIAISPKALNNWQAARTSFLKALRRLPK